ncbi:hypothetical protein WMF18_00535 [Sorangium sp. So ce315]|uniref:hypothetical protein n=1 Tax=Sorangium sp. So ce315 TaxID=3133299 RepID=UPI003F5DA022
MRHRRTTRASGVALLCAGCGADAPEAGVCAARDLGPLAFAPEIRGRDGGCSARRGGRSVWGPGDTTLQTPGEALAGFLTRDAGPSVNVAADRAPRRRPWSRRR